MKNTSYNIGLALWLLKCFFEIFKRGSTLVILLKFCAKNPPHRQARNRYAALFCMRAFSLILMCLISFSCNIRQSENAYHPIHQKFYDSIRESSKAADILYFREFVTSKISILAGQHKTPQGIDSVLSYFGSESLDTTCSVFSSGGPIGEILFYRDTSRTELVAGFNFTFADNCTGFYDGFEGKSTKITMSVYGRKYLEDLHNKVKSYWTK